MPAPKILLELLNDDIISRRKLILKRYRYIGLTEKEAMYFIAASYIDGELITASRLANLLELSKAAVEKTLARSLERKLIKIKFIDDKKSRMIIDISPMMEALLSTYFELPESASLEDQTSWVIYSLSLQHTSVQRKELQSWMVEGGFKRLQSIVDGLRKIEATGIDFVILKKLYDDESAKSITDVKKLKELVTTDWLN